MDSLVKSAALTPLDASCVSLFGTSLALVQNSRKNSPWCDEMVLIDADAFLFALPEADLERAIRLLDASSQQITARACGLTTQQTLLNTRGSRTASRLNVLQSDSNRNITTKSQHTRLTNEARLADLTDDIQTRLTILDKDSKAASATVNQCLKSNDRILDALGRDACTDTVATELSELSSRIQQLSHMLQIKGVTAVKDRLDRVYLTALESRTSRAELQTRAADVIPEVKQDIQSLYTEIEDVVVLMAGHEHLQKLEHSIAAASLEQRYQWEQTLQEVSPMQFMRTSLIPYRPNSRWSI